MARKLTDVVQINLRIREKMRRQLEKAAAKRQVSLNYEMVSRIQETFDGKSLFDLDMVTEEMKNAWARYAEPFHALNLQGNLLRATEVLIGEVEKTDAIERAPIRKAVDKARTHIKAMENEAKMLLRRMHTAGEEVEALTAGDAVYMAKAITMIKESKVKAK
jgi:hypothetical protein